MANNIVTTQQAVGTVLEMQTNSGPERFLVEPPSVPPGPPSGGSLYAPFTTRPAPTPAGLIFTPSDSPYQYMADGAQWLIQAGDCRMPEAGDLTAFANQNPIGADALGVVGGFTRATMATTNTTALEPWLAPTPIAAGPGGVWTLECAMRYQGRRVRGAAYSSFGLVLGDGGTNYIAFGVDIQATEFLGLLWKNYSDVHTQVGTTAGTDGALEIAPPVVMWLRIRFDGTDYWYEYSLDGMLWRPWVIGAIAAAVAGGAFLVPTTWGIGSGYNLIFPEFALGSSTTPNFWDVLHLAQSPTF